MNAIDLQITFEGVSFSYSKNHWILNNITEKIDFGEFIGVIGPNSGGKSTLVKLILGMLNPTIGEIKINNKSPKKSSHLLGYVPQLSVIESSFPCNIHQLIQMGEVTGKVFFPISKKSSHERADELVEVLGLQDKVKEHFNYLSGGFQKRVLIGRSLMCEPKILVLDEPTAGLDPDAENGIYQLLAELNKDKTIIVVSHDLNFVSRYMNRVFCVGEHFHVHATEDITDEMARLLYRQDVRLVKHNRNEGVCENH